MFDSPRMTAWRYSAPHLLLLSKFIHGDSAARYAEAEYWKSALKEEPKEVIQRFIQEGMLEPAGLAELMDHKFKASELKEILKARLLKVSGRKPEMISRLVDSDKEGMVSATKDVKLLKCSAEAIRLAEVYIECVKERKAEAGDEVLRLLENREYANAVRTVAAFEAAQVFPRGLGIDWTSYSTHSDVKLLKTIFEKRPHILNNIDAARLEKIRVAAAMMQLWGTNTTKPWLPEDFTTGIHLHTESAARMLVFYASHLRGIEQYKEAGIKTVEVLGVGDGSTCSACQQIDRLKYQLGNVPELPYPSCKSEIGCRCTTVAADF